jgi:hypothetical protein
MINGSAAGHAADGKFTASHLAKWLEWFRAKKSILSIPWVSTSFYQD